ncbi:baseplate J/gp47 family protein, partial [Enterobacter ludwigii]
MDTKDFNTLVAEQVAAIQGGSSSLLDTTIGSILRAVVEAYSAVAMWLQSLVLNLLALTRAATSSGADLDSWVGDFGVTRIGAEYADGMVRFARYTATSQAVVPVGSIAQTRDGSQQYSVQADATQSTWDASLKGYVLPPGITSVLVPVQALVAGADGNAVVGA